MKRGRCAAGACVALLAASLTFTQPGYYEYVCVEHPNLPTMHGLFWVDPAAPL